MSVVSVRWKSLFAVVVAAVLGAGLMVAPASAQPQPAPASVAAAGTTSPVPVRGDVIGRRGVKVRDVTVGNSGQLVTARVFWNQRMIARKGDNDRFNIRLLAFPAGAGAVPIVLAARSKAAVPPKIQNVRIKLSKSAARQLRSASDAVLSVSQQYGSPARADKKFDRNHVSVTHLSRGSNRSAPAALEPSTRVGRDCSTIEIIAGADLSGCDLSGANLTNAILTGCDLSGADLSGAIVTGVISGGVTGTPASLPLGWALVGGYLVPQGSTPTPTPIALSCAGGGVCVVGDVGPGGGTVFYVATAPFTSTGSTCYVEGCLYLEAAKTDWDNTGDGEDPVLVWALASASCYQNVAGAVSWSIGNGMANTAAITATLAPGCPTATDAPAAWAAKNYTNIGVSDWFLPSQNELNQLCRWAWNEATGPAQTGVCGGGEGGAPPVGGFAAVGYWSSSQGHTFGAWLQGFGNGRQGSVSKSSIQLGVRPVRAF